jgi:4-hydroxy-tetrahydrodipicolinate synthase
MERSAHHAWLDSQPFAGVLPAVLTPFCADLAIDDARFLEICRWLLDQGADGLALFGTTGEGPSLGIGERRAAIEALVAGGIPASKLLVGAGACSLSDAVELTRAAVGAGAGGVLCLPPFYYKGVSEDGLYAFYTGLIERVADSRLRLYLYHIPPVAQVGIPHALIERLRAAYGDVVAGIKDSSGDPGHLRSLLDTFPGFGIFAGSERLLLATLRAGGAGCITALGNLAAARICALYAAYHQGAAEARLDPLQASLDALRPALADFPTIPMLKAAHALRLGDAGWSTMRPPLESLPAQRHEALAAALASVGLVVASS